jgi:hypothetical protein
MDTTKSFIKVHDIGGDDAEDFEFEYDVATSDLLSGLVPNRDNWGGVGWIELDEYEYNLRLKQINLSLNTKWESPVEWLRNASLRTHYLSNKLITMTTLQKDETCVRGVAVMDGEVLQNKYIFEVSPEEVAKYYSDDEPDYDLDALDNNIWDSIAKFVNVCEQFYLEKEEKND